MKIGILSRWNATCGVSLHAELIGRELINRGYSIEVFAPKLQSANLWWHHKLIREDEDFVRRVYTELTPDGKEGSFDLDAVEGTEIDFLIVESYEKMPYRGAERFVRKLKEREIPAVAVIHEGSYEDIKYDLDIFEKVIVFDERYVKEVVKNRVSEDKILVLPYPCLPPKERKRDFAQDGKVKFFSFGRQPKEEYKDFIEALEKLAKEFDIQYTVVRASDPLDVERPWMVQRSGVLDLEDIYEYLMNSDFHLLPKGKTRRVVVSSTFCQTVGSLAITVSLDSRFFEAVPKGEYAPLITYENSEDLYVKLKKAIEDESYRERIRENAKRYAQENSVEKITDKFEALINSVLVKDVE